MQVTEFIDRYARLLKQYQALPSEALLLEAADLGRELILAQVPPEEIAEIHEAALSRVGTPAVHLNQVAPLMEILVAYGLAFRERQESRLRAEQEVKEREKLIATIVETTGALVVVLDPSGAVVRFNPASQTLSGYSSEDVQTKRLQDILLLPRAVAEFEQILAAVDRAGSPVHFEQSWVTKDQQLRQIQWSCSALRGAEDKLQFVVCTGLDVTEKRLVEAQMQHQEKMAAAGALASGIAHEIGNPLAGISGALQVLGERTQDPGIREVLDLISPQVVRISRTLRQLANLARTPEKEPQACSVNKIIEDTFQLIRYDRRALGVAVGLDLDPNVPDAWAMKDQLAQVFMNIGLNALDALECNPPEREPKLRVTTRFFQPGRVRVMIEDNGCGFPPESAEKIFQPFFTTKAPGRGTGLGLPICRRIVEAHGGTVWVETRKGEGTRFFVDLPIRDLDSQDHYSPAKD